MIKCWAIYSNLPVNAIVRLRRRRSKDGQCQETFLPPFAHKKVRNYDSEGSNHHASLSILGSKGLNRSKMKWWAIYTNLLVNAIVKLPHLHSRDSQDQEKFLASSADKQTRNYYTECSNHHSSLSTLMSNGLRRTKMKVGARYTNLPVRATVRLPHPQSRDIQGQKMFLTPSAYKWNPNYDTDCSNHHPSL